MKRGTEVVVNWLGGIALVVFVVYGGLSLWAHIALRRASAPLEAAGRPMRFEQLKPFTIPGAYHEVVITNVMTKLEAVQHGRSNSVHELHDLAMIIYRNEDDDEIREQFRAIVQLPEVRDVLDLLRLPHDGPEWKFDAAAYWAEEPKRSYLQVRRLWLICSARARVNALEGRVSEAWEHVIAGLRLANAYHATPDIVAQSMRAGVFGGGSVALTFVAEHGLPSQEQHNELTELLRTFESIDPFVKAIDAERLFYSGLLSNARRLRGYWDSEDPGPSGLPPDMIPAFLLPPLRRLDCAAYLRGMHASTQLALASYSPADIEIREQIERDIPWYARISQHTIPRIDRLKLTQLRMMARARVLRAGLAALRHHQETSAFPDSIDALGESDLVDPFTGGDLMYSASEPGFTIRGADDWTEWRYGTDASAEPGTP